MTRRYRWVKRATAGLSSSAQNSVPSPAAAASVHVPSVVQLESVPGFAESLSRRGEGKEPAISGVTHQTSPEVVPLGQTVAGLSASDASTSSSSSAVASSIRASAHVTRPHVPECRVEVKDVHQGARDPTPPCSPFSPFSQELSVSRAASTPPGPEIEDDFSWDDDDIGDRKGGLPMNSYKETPYKRLPPVAYDQALPDLSLMPSVQPRLVWSFAIATLMMVMKEDPLVVLTVMTCLQFFMKSFASLVRDSIYTLGRVPDWWMRGFEWVLDLSREYTVVGEALRPDDPTADEKELLNPVGTQPSYWEQTDIYGSPPRIIDIPRVRVKHNAQAAGRAGAAVVRLMRRNEDLRSLPGYGTDCVHVTDSRFDTHWVTVLPRVSPYSTLLYWVVYVVSALSTYMPMVLDWYHGIVEEGKKFSPAFALMRAVSLLQISALMGLWVEAIVAPLFPNKPSRNYHVSATLFHECLSRINIYAVDAQAAFITAFGICTRAYGINSPVIDTGLSAHTARYVRSYVLQMQTCHEHIRSQLFRPGPRVIAQQFQSTAKVIQLVGQDYQTNMQ